MSRDTRALRRASIMAIVAGTTIGLANASVLAGPKGTRAIRGKVEVVKQGDLTTFRVGKRAILWHDSFNIGAGETVRFVQPGKRARVLNRIDSALPSRIDGAIEANGKVFIVNKAGVVFGPNSVLNVGQLYAAGGDISNRDFLRGTFRFSNITGDIVSEGAITADAVHLIGSRVENHGTVVADGGVVTMLVGDDVLIRERGSQILLRVDGRPIDSANGPGRGATGAAPGANAIAAIENTGSIDAGAGRITLGAGDAYSLAIRNSGALRAPSGSIDVIAHAGTVENLGTLSTSVGSGDAGRITVHAPTLIQRGTITANADSGHAGSVEVASGELTYLANGSMTSAAGGDGIAAGGDVLVHSYEGGTIIAPGATIDISGGAAGGDGGIAEISAAHGLGIHGTILGDAQLGFAPAAVLFDPFDIVVAALGPDDAELIDGIITSGDGLPTDVFRITPAAIEGFGGDVTLEAINSIYIASSIDKANGGLILDAGNLISMSDEFGGFVTNLTIRADHLDFTAGSDIVERIVFGAHLWSTSGDISLTSQTGSIKFHQAHVPSGRTVHLTQAQSKFVGAGPFGFIANPEDTNLVIDITDGFLVFGGDFGGVSSFQHIGNVEASASEFIRVEDNLLINGSAIMRARDDIIVQGYIHAQESIDLHAALDGTGTITFDRTFRPSLDLWASSITLRAGNDAGLALARVDLGAVAGTEPILRGPGGGDTRPDSFTLVQDAPIGDADVPAPARFGDSDLSGMHYRLESSDADVSIDDASKVDSTHLTLAGETGSFVNQPLTLLDFTIIGSGVLNADVTTSGFQFYGGPVTYSGDRVLIASSINFDDTLDATTDCSGGVVLNADTTFGGSVGSLSPLRFLTVNGQSEIAGGGVTTCKDQSYNGVVDLLADARLLSTEDGTIRFGATLDGTHDLDVLTGSGGLIVFAGDVGQNSALLDVFLSTAWPSGVRNIPLVATIIGENDLRIDARTFGVTEHEKFTILGSLELTAAQRTTVGDIVTTGSMTIDAPVIRLLLRQPSLLLDSDGTVKNDAGLDFVSGGDIIFNGVTQRAGDAFASDPLFGLPSGSTFSVSLSGAQRVRSNGSRTAADSLIFDAIILDQNVVSSAPPIGPEDIEFVDPRADIPLFRDTVQPEPYNVALLQRLAIDSRGVDTDTSIGGMIGRLIYNDMPGDNVSFGVAQTMTATRFHLPAVMILADTYAEVFGDNEPVRTAEISRSFEDAAVEYAAASGADRVDPDRFMSFMQSDPRHEQAARYTDGLATLVGQLSRLGLPGDEYRVARDQLISAVLPPGMTPAEFAQLLESIAAEQLRQQRAGIARRPEPAA